MARPGDADASSGSSSAASDTGSHSPPPADDDDTRSEADWCVVCFENPPDAVLEPCGHANLCVDCVSRLTKRRCPTCRARAKRVRIYVGRGGDQDEGLGPPGDQGRPAVETGTTAAELARFAREEDRDSMATAMAAVEAETQSPPTLLSLVSAGESTTASTQTCEPISPTAGGAFSSADSEPLTVPVQAPVPSPVTAPSPAQYPTLGPVSVPGPVPVSGPAPPSTASAKYQPSFPSEKYIVKTVKQLIAERRMRESRVLEDTLQIVFLGPQDTGKRTLVRGLLEKYALPPSELPPTPSLITDADADVYGSGSDFSANARIAGTRVRLSVLRRGTLTSRRMLLDDVRTLKPDILVMCASAHVGPTFDDLLVWDKILRTNLSVPRLWALLTHPDMDKAPHCRDPHAPPIADLDHSLNVPATIAAISPAANRPRAHYLCATTTATFSIGLRSLTKDMLTYGRSARDEALAAAVAQAEEASAAAESAATTVGAMSGGAGAGGRQDHPGVAGTADPSVTAAIREAPPLAAAAAAVASLNMATHPSSSAPMLQRPRASSDANRERGQVNPLGSIHSAASASQGLLGQRATSLRGLNMRTARESAREVNQSVTNFVNWFTGSPQ